ncbi:tRNA lysidine(34) synthetase TilS [Pantanalinema sp. GBBB05]|uniref:tRNA lysidine(34) synthetase TilS n=1 Tax=Pantanalinema sp. GBBB05 TaxID=2604139 RepID=UPI001E0BEF1E|nr:tRNA lysidine(34) synthetase TilS [Pantanalinema sp. GBBB05]
MSDRSSVWTDLHSRLHRTLKVRSLLPPGQPVLMAISGGQDSLCLGKLLLDLREKWDWQLAIAHCDHRWQGDEGNAEFVQAIAASWQIPYYPVTALAPIPPTEAAARTWRYQQLTKLAQQQGFSIVVTGHTASDRAETLLYNLVRGSGADGLQALTWQRALAPGIHLSRPLLTVTRRETAEFCQSIGLTAWDDIHNQNLQYARNRIRQELIPYLQAHLNPQVESALAQTAELLHAEVTYLESEAQRVYQQVVWQGEGDEGGKTDEESKTTRTPSLSSLSSLSSLPAPTPHLGLNRRLLRTQPLALQRRVMRMALQSVLPVAPQFDHIEKLVALLTAPNRSQTDPFPGGTIAHVAEDWIWLQALASG